MKKTKIWMLILMISIFLSICVGRYGLSIIETMKSLFLIDNGIGSRLIYIIRLPRVLMAVFCGASLSCAGMIFQTLFKNGLASPDVLGTTSGCSFGAIVGILMGNQFLGIEIMSFIFGSLSLFLVFFLSRKAKGQEMVNLLISGIIVQAIFTSMIMTLKIVADPYQQLPSIEYWLMGGFSDVDWFHLLFSALVMGVCIFILYRMRWMILVLAFGDEANTLGLPVKKIRFIVLALSTILVSSVVSVVGPVSWVGLMIPHFVRQWKNQSIVNVFGFTALIGSIFVLWCDTISRSLFAVELPVSIVTSFFGALYLMALFKKGKKIL